MANNAYIHGTDSSEQERLALLNRLTNHAFLDFLSLADARSILEIDSGLGLLAEQIETAGFQDIELSIAPEIHHAGAPTFRPWVENLIGNVRSGAQELQKCQYHLPYTKREEFNGNDNTRTPECETFARGRGADP
jgi:hypothetical protein